MNYRPEFSLHKTYYSAFDYKGLTYKLGNKALNAFESHMQNIKFRTNILNVSQYENLTI